MQVVPFELNTIVHLNSGSPALKVVQSDTSRTTVEWLDSEELKSLNLPTVCFRSVPR